MRLAKVKPRFLLDVGCGFQKQKGFTGMDKRRVPGVDIVHDIEHFPWPIASGAVHLVVMTHVVEHIKPWLQIQMMDECCRILEPNGALLIKTPYGGSHRYYQDSTHCTPWVEETVMYFCVGSLLYEVYKPKPWKLEQLAWDIRDDIEMALRKLPLKASTLSVKDKNAQFGSWRPKAMNASGGRETK